MRSIRRSLLAATIGLGSLAFLASGGLLYWLVRGSLYDEFDRRLADTARLLEATVEEDNGELEIELGELRLTEFVGQHPAAYLEIRGAGGRSLYRSPPVYSLPRQSNNGGTAFYSAHLPDGRRGRWICDHFYARGSTERLTLILGRELAPLDRTLLVLQACLLGVAVLGLTALGAAQWLAVRWGLRPLDRLAAAIAGLKASTALEVDFADRTREIEPVRTQLNELLVRLEVAMRRERALGAAVAHELRTPLAGLQLQLDVALSQDRQAADYRRSLTECSKITRQMGQLVDNLLTLVRLESRSADRATEQVDLKRAMLAAWADFELAACCRRLSITWSLADDLAIHTYPAHLATVLRNLFANAIEYANEGGTVRVTSQPEGGGARLIVANSGSRLSAEEAARAAEPFWRGDTARSGTDMHCGLGLTLVERLVAVMGGTLDIRSTADGDFEAHLRLPELVNGEPPTR